MRKGDRFFFKKKKKRKEERTKKIAVGRVESEEIFLSNRKTVNQIESGSFINSNYVFNKNQDQIFESITHKNQLSWAKRWWMEIRKGGCALKEKKNYHFRCRSVGVVSRVEKQTSKSLMEKKNERRQKLDQDLMNERRDQFL